MRRGRWDRARQLGAQVGMVADTEWRGDALGRVTRGVVRVVAGVVRQKREESGVRERKIGEEKQERQKTDSSVRPSQCQDLWHCGRCQDLLCQAYICPTGLAGLAQYHGVPCRRLSGHYEPSCLAGRASTGFVLGLRPKARPAGYFSCRAGPRPIKPTTSHFHNIFTKC